MPMKPAILASSSLIALTLSAPMAHAADDCKPLQFVASFQMPGDFAERPTLPVSINGTPRRLLFDTGGTITQISPTVADALKMPRRDSPIKLFDVSGNISDKMAIADSFAIGPLKSQNMEMQITAGSMGDLDGLITPSLYRLDIDVDFGPGRFTYFSQDHCPGKVLYWKAAAIAAVPINPRSLHINIPVMVDGHLLHAIIDTGATSTFMDQDTAKRVFGLTPDSPGMTAAGVANDDSKLALYGHVFDSLSFEGVAVSNPAIRIIPNRVASKDPNNGLQTGSLIKRTDDDLDISDLTIGMNILSKLHLFFAFKENKVYITPAGAPDEPSPFPTLAK